MNLDLPVPTVTQGPEWAEQINEAFETVDDHDHTAGKGKPIPASGLNINDDVPLNQNNLTSARSYNMANLALPISDPADVRSLYAVGGELYYNDGAGNQIQLTSGGALNAATVGGIGGDYTSPASVYYSSVSKTYFFDQNTNQRAKLDIGDLLIRETVAGSNAITIKSPASLGAAFTLTLPSALPGSQLPLTITNTGLMQLVQITTAMIGDDQVTSDKLADNSVLTAAIGDDQVTAAKIIDYYIQGRLVMTEINGSNAGITTGNFTVPANVTKMWVSMVGAGGGGGASGRVLGGTAGGGGGGGAGEEAHFWLNVTPGDQYGYRIGVGGTGGTGGVNDYLVGQAANSGTDGDVTRFGPYAVRGGYGGQGAQTRSGSTMAPGIGGDNGGNVGGDTITTPDTVGRGGNGGSGGSGGGNGVSGGKNLLLGNNGGYAGVFGGSFGVNGGGGGGGGASSSMGDGGEGGVGGHDGSVNAQSGTDGQYGAGGGGGGAPIASGAEVSQDGGDGGPGKIIVYYFS